MDHVNYILVLLIGLLCAVAAVAGMARRFAISYPIVLVVAFRHFISLGSIVSAACFPIVVWLTLRPPAPILAAACAAGVCAASLLGSSRRPIQRSTRRQTPQCWAFDAVPDDRWIGLPQQRTAHVDEIAAVIAFLVSPQASYVSGVILPVDGGATAALAGLPFPTRTWPDAEVPA